MKEKRQNEAGFGKIVELATVLYHVDDFDTILQTISAKTPELVGGDDAAILMVNPRTQHTVKTVFRERDQTATRYRNLHNLFAGWILKYNKPLYIRDIKKDAVFQKAALKDLPIKSVMGVPLRIENYVVGILIVLASEKEFDKKDLDYFEKIAVIASPYLRDVEALTKYFAPPLQDETLLSKYAALGLVGKSKKFLSLLRNVEAAASTEVRVLLEGQSGTGKELVARAVHKLSARYSHKFVAIDCGAIPTNLIESELFGHARGAFTGANYERKGLFEEAHLGTLFMDEIAGMPMDMQAKLLRVLQEGEIKPVGSNRVKKVDVRIIAASSQQLQKLVDEEKFRQDLFYRLYVYPISIPSLGERRQDISLLANHFLDRFSKGQNKKVNSFHAGVLNFMNNRTWNGNIRELENFVERLVTLVPADATRVEAKHLPPDLHKEYKRQKPDLDAVPSARPLNESLTDYEADIIGKTLQECDWNQSKAARVLRISEQTMRYKISKLGITRRSFS